MFLPHQVQGKGQDSHFLKNQNEGQKVFYSTNRVPAHLKEIQQEYSSLKQAQPEDEQAH